MRNAAIAKTGAVTPARRIKQAAMNDLWLRAMVLAPSVSSLSASILGDQDMTGCAPTSSNRTRRWR
jgi:hypothetical protein